MESFEEIRQMEFAHLTGEIGTLGRRLVELGWSREEVFAYVKQLVNEPTGATDGGPHASRKEC
jgi:hypothetical protein